MQNRGWSTIRRGALVLLLTGVGLLLASQLALVEAATWGTGDVFTGVSDGSYKVFDNSGVFKETISNGLGGFTTGCAFNPALDKLYTADFSATQVIVYDNADPHPILQTIDTGIASPNGASESIVFDAIGNFYVGHAGGNHLIHKYDAAGTLLATFSATPEDRGTDWIELAADGCTLFYTSEATSIKRFDVCTNTQLPDFASGLHGAAYALRILLDGGVLVADSIDIHRLDSTGAIVQTYDAPGEDSWFSLNIDPNGTSFWSGDFVSANVYRFNIATGAIEVGPINTGTGASTLFGVCVKGERTVVVSGNKCPLSQGFWKTHPDAWPVTSLTLGSQTYSQTELLALLNTPVRGDASLTLAHQLIAAKLNIAHGANPTLVSATIADADAVLSGFAGKLPYHVAPSSATGQAMVNDANVLDAYNNGHLTPDCQP